jgi:hypothetical protein
LVVGLIVSEISQRISPHENPRVRRLLQFEQHAQEMVSTMVSTVCGGFGNHSLLAKVKVADLTKPDIRPHDGRYE